MLSLSAVAIGILGEGIVLGRKRIGISNLILSWCLTWLSYLSSEFPGEIAGVDPSCTGNALGLPSIGYLRE